MQSRVELIVFNRIGLTLDKTNQTIICQRVAHRKEIYQIFP